MLVDLFLPAVLTVIMFSLGLGLGLSDLVIAPLPALAPLSHPGLLSVHLAKWTLSDTSAPSAGRSDRTLTQRFQFSLKQSIANVTRVPKARQCIGDPR